jgi:predicted Zn-dependent peptidase
VDKVTKADIKRVANNAFQDNNRTIGSIETVMDPAAAGKAAN